MDRITRAKRTKDLIRAYKEAPNKKLKDNAFNALLKDYHKYFFKLAHKYKGKNKDLSETYSDILCMFIDYLEYLDLEKMIHNDFDYMGSLFNRYVFFLNNNKRKSKKENFNNKAIQFSIMKTDEEGFVRFEDTIPANLKYNEDFIELKKELKVKGFLKLFYLVLSGKGISYMSRIFKTTRYNVELKIKEMSSITKNYKHLLEVLV